MSRALTITALTLTVGCSVQAPPATQPELDMAVPEVWSTASTDDASSDREPIGPSWWQDFGAAGLDVTVERALAYNTDLLAAEARLRQAEASARIAGADLKPSVGASLTGSRRKQNFIGFPIPGSERSVLSTESTNLGVSVDVSWEIDLWGRLGAQARSGLAAYQASAADLAGARLSIAGQTVKAWFAVGAAQQQVDLATTTVESFGTSVRQVRDRFERGVRPSLDLRLATASLAGAEALLQSRQRQLDAASRQLEVLLGLYPDRALEFPERLGEVAVAVPAGLPADLLARRPDLAAAERRLVAADQQLAVARASLYPRLSLTASGGTSSDSLRDLVDGDFSVWSFVGNLLQPIFQGGRLRAGVDLAAAGIDESTALYVGTALRAYSEVETALAAEEILGQRVRHLREAAEHSVAAQRLAEQRYRSGLGDYITVLESQRRALQNESNLIDGLREHLDNRVDLYLALGGGFHSDQISIPRIASEAAPRPGSREDSR